MTTTKTFNLSQLTDLALGTPEVGAVNFNVLHTLLHAMLKQMNIENITTELSEEDRVLLARSQKQASDAGVSSSSSDGDSGRPRSAYHSLEVKVSQMEEKLDMLNDLPSNANLLDRTASGTSLHGGEKSRPVNEMWQMMQTQKKVQANEEGIGKLMSLVEDLMEELNTVKQANKEFEKFKSQIEKLVSGDLVSRIDQLEEKNKSMRVAQEDMQRNITDLSTRLDQLPPPGEFDSFIRWQHLEDAISGVKSDFKSMQASRSNEAIGQSSGTSLPGGSSTSLSKSRNGPSAEGFETLKRLGLLDSKHTKLEERVGVLEAQMSFKVDREELMKAMENSKIPDNLLQDLESLKNAIDQLKSDRGQFSHSQATLGMSDKVSPSSVPALGGNVSQTEALQTLMSNIPPATLPSAPTTGIELNPPATVNHDITAAVNHDITAADRDLTQIIDNLVANFYNHEKYFDALRSEIGQLKQVTHDLQSSISHATVAAEEALLTAQSSVNDDRPADQNDSPRASPRGAGQGGAGTPDGPATSLHRLPSRTHSMMNRCQEQLTYLSDHVSEQVSRLNNRLDSINKQDRSVAAENRRLSVEKVASLTVASDNEAMQAIQNAIVKLQEEQEKLNNTCTQLIDEHNVKQKHIDALYTFVDRLQENKADKEHVMMEIELKADKRMVDNKVGKGLFDSTCNDLRTTLQDMLSKLAGHEDAWRKAVNQLVTDIEQKLDRMELEPLKEYLEGRIKAIKPKIIKQEITAGDDEAAGFRKPMLQRFHCISCDRPVNLPLAGPIPSLPGTESLPGTRSARPYTTFELEQIRLAQKGSINQEIPEYISTNRSCGGSHTLTYPSKRSGRSATLSSQPVPADPQPPEEEEIQPVSFLKSEMDLLGVDGHIYKGRKKTALDQTLPNIDRPPSKQSLHRSAKPRTPRTTVSPVPPSDPPTPGRPLSARQSSRPHRPSSGRPKTAQGLSSDEQSAPQTPVPDADPEEPAPPPSVTSPGPDEGAPEPTQPETNE